MFGSCGSVQGQGSNTCALFFLRLTSSVAVLCITRPRRPPFLGCWICLRFFSIGPCMSPFRGVSFASQVSFEVGNRYRWYFVCLDERRREPGKECLKQRLCRPEVVGTTGPGFLLVLFRFALDLSFRHVPFRFTMYVFVSSCAFSLFFRYRRFLFVSFRFFSPVLISACFS